MMIRLALLTTAALIYCQCQAQLIFTDVAGDEAILDGYGENFFGGGLSFADFDGDGLDDLTISSEKGRPLEFYRNLGFALERVDPPLVDLTEETEQILWFDYDNDGDSDLFVAVNWGTGNRLYRNDGGTFTDVTADVGITTDSLPTYAACVGDYDRDGWLDLYITNRSGLLYPYHNLLYRNQGDGTFQDITAPSNAWGGVEAPLAVVFHDVDADMWPDILIANDRYFGNQYLHNKGDGTFEELSLASGFYEEMNAMGISPGDYDADGDFDYYISNTPEGNALMQNDGAGNFVEVAADAGCGYYGIAWGVHFLDADNDGDLDLFSGGLYQAPENTPSTLYLNDGAGNLSISGILADTSARNYGNAIGDLNNDGYPDLAVLNVDPYPHRIWKNGGGSNRWLKVELEGVISNRDGVGALVEIEYDGGSQMRFTHCGTSYLSQDANYAWFGLGSDDIVELIRVTWPSGLVDEMEFVPADQKVLITEGTTTSVEEPGIPMLSVFPNPASDFLNLQLPELAYQWEILSLSGELKLAGQGSGNSRIGLTDLAPGLYQIRVQTDDEQAVRRFARIR